MDVYASCLAQTCNFPTFGNSTRSYTYESAALLQRFIDAHPWQWRFYDGARGAQAPKSCPGPPNFLVELIGSIVILLSRGRPPNDEGPGPQIFFSRTATGPWLTAGWSVVVVKATELTVLLKCHFSSFKCPGQSKVFGNMIGRLAYQPTSLVNVNIAG